MAEISKNLIFNPMGNDDVAARTIIKGSTTGLFNLNAVKYPWAKSLYRLMIGNFWIPEKVSGLKDDARMFHLDLSPDEQRAYKGIIHNLIKEGPHLTGIKPSSLHPGQLDRKGVTIQAHTHSTHHGRFNHGRS